MKCSLCEHELLLLDFPHWFRSSFWPSCSSHNHESPIQQCHQDHQKLDNSTKKIISFINTITTLYAKRKKTFFFFTNSEQIDGKKTHLLHLKFKLNIILTQNERDINLSDLEHWNLNSRREKLPKMKAKRKGKNEILKRIEMGKNLASPIQQRN